DIAISISLLSLVAVLGLWIGNWRVYGVGFGIGGVLFGGLFVGHFVGAYRIVLDEHTLHFVREFGLILFVYTIGIQVGPGFFSSLRSSGLKLNGFAALLVILSALTALLLHKFFAIPLPVILGVFSGAVTNTPSLGAGQQILTELGATSASVGSMGAGYAVAYPFGICGILLAMWLVRLFFKINIEKEAERWAVESGQNKENLHTMNVAVQNPNLEGLKLNDIPGLTNQDVVCSRLKRNGELMVPKPETIIHLGDVVHLVGETAALNSLRLVIGAQVEVSLSTAGTDFSVERVVVTNEQVLGKKIRELHIWHQYDVVVSRIHRAGVELIPSTQTSLQFGDILNLVGRPEAIEAVANIVGNSKHKLLQVQMLPVFIGIGLGVLLGSVPFFIPGFPAALKLGLAGGPLVVALLLSRLGSIGKLYWFMPPSANLALRELGIVLFLGVVGLKSGGNFLHTLTQGDGLLWMLYGAAITFIPLMIVGFLARAYGRLDYLTLCGLLAGSMTDPPALAFANNMHPTCGASALAYATVYPMVMFMRIVSPQLLAILLWAGP
ncbi:MAG TPA: putative transporter, partial [Rhodocyclaceae bacterium]|nr:putative transporter [Rhodocyclaceae bacterium]